MKVRLVVRRARKGGTILFMVSRGREWKTIRPTGWKLQERMLVIV